MLIAEGDLKEPIRELQKIAKNSTLLNEVIIQSGRLSDLSKAIHRGTIRYDDAHLTANQITEAVLNLVDEIDFEMKNNAAVKKEVDQFFASYEKFKEQENQMTLEQIKARSLHFDDYDKFISSMPPGERFELQKLNSENYLKEFGLTAEELKKKLQQLNYFNGEINNEFTRELANSLEMFQVKNNMRHIDGFFGELTYDMIALRLKEL